MRQAIEEHFILDVLRNYTTYKAYYKLIKAIEDDPKVSKKQATTQLAQYMSLHEHNIAQKTRIIVEHFRTKVRHKIGGRAKAMVVTRSRLHAVRYRRAFEAYIKEQGYNDIGVLVAFSGTVTDPDNQAEYTEVGMNDGIKERELPEKFGGDEYQLLLVANKYQTGFDQPLLHTMYVDKRLSGVQAVQTLSRLNRTAPGKEDTFVLDFVNDAEEIQRSFQPYYEQTVVAETADPHQLYDLQGRLDDMQVYWTAEVEAFCKLFYKPKATQKVTDQAEMYHQLGPAVDRFKALDEEKQEEFRNVLTGYVRLYSFLSQIMPFRDADLEKLYTFGRYLELKLPRDERKAPLPLDGDVALKYYRIDKITEGQVVLFVAEPMPLKSPTDVGTRKAKDDEAALSEIIESLNERFGTEFTSADQLLFDQFVESAKQDQAVVDSALANPIENFELAMKPRIDELMIDRMEQNRDIVDRYNSDESFESAVFTALVKRIYAEIRRSGSQPPASR